MSKFNPTNFNVQKDIPNFPQMEEEIFEYWNKIKAFDQQLEKTKDLPKFTFYDGPPFATGTPHYGHICAGTIKDVITRYASMDGHYVERRFGWDCHGLPIEHAIDKKLGIKNRNSIYEMGIDKYNDECRKIVMTYSEQWRYIVQRLGRWVDFDNDYKTMDRSFMESVWWVFKQIYDKGLVYRGCKIMPYSTKCLTVLSNFEASQNYKNVSDPAIVVTFPIKGQEDVQLLAWTTTPWTLPSNLALSVNPNFTYVKVKDLKNNNIYILAKCRLVELYKSGAEFKNCEGTSSSNDQVKNKKGKKNKKKKGKGKQNQEQKNEQQQKEQKVDVKEFEILEEMKGKDLEGTEYIPLFNYYEEQMKPKGCFKVLCGDHVTSGAGTGIVHTAPAFGEEDYTVCRKYDIIDPSDPCVSIDENGQFLDLVKEYKGMYIKDADKQIMKDLKERKRLVKQGQIVHSYPFCWRSDTPLIYMAQNTWFIRVTELRDKLLVNNLKSRWVPEFAQKQRFQKWLENVNDWCFSRNRFWGNPIPIWASDDFEEIVCVGSVEELKKLTGIKEDIPDLHMDKIQDITIPSQKGKGQLKRIPETFDCWFESGSMPYASKGYPFKMSKEEFDKQFPGEFIGEGIDQCRGWFYTLNVIGTALYDTCPFQNLIVNGIVLAEDGTKMSKSKKNYPDPMLVVDKYGADAIRLYLMNSPLVYGQDLRFKEEGVQKVVKYIFLPWYFLFKLILQEIQRYEKNTQTLFEYDENLFTKESDIKFDNPMDQWILANTQKILQFVRQEFDNYRLSTVLKRKLRYLDQLSNWYVNMNKKRFKGENGPQDQYLALNILFHCFFQSITLMAPYVPFIVDYFYQQLRLVIHKDSKSYQESIHFLRIPKPIDKFDDVELVQAVEIFQKVMSVQRREREVKDISKKLPLQNLMIHLRNKNLQSKFEKLVPILKQVGNFKNIEFGQDFNKYAKFRLQPNFVGIKESLPEDEQDKIGILTPLINKLKQEQVTQFLENNEIEVSYNYKGKQEKMNLDEDKILIKCQINSNNKNENLVIQGDHDFVIEINFETNDELQQEYLAREITNRIQKSRKNAKVKIDDKILIVLEFNDNANKLKDVFQNKLEFIKSIVKKPVTLNSDNLVAVELYSENCNIKNQDMTLRICSIGLKINNEQLEKVGNVEKLSSMLSSMDPLSLDKDQNLKLLIEDKEIVLEKGTHFDILK